MSPQLLAIVLVASSSPVTPPTPVPRPPAQGEPEPPDDVAEPDEVDPAEPPTTAPSDDASIDPDTPDDGEGPPTSPDDVQAPPDEVQAPPDEAATPDDVAAEPTDETPLDDEAFVDEAFDDEAFVDEEFVDDDYDPRRDSPEALEATRWVRTGIAMTSVGGALLIGATIFGALDPCTKGVGNSCQAAASRRAAVTMAVPGVVLVAGGTAALIVGLRRRNRIAASVTADRTSAGLVVVGRF